jgi:hypothetical protein
LAAKSVNFVRDIVVFDNLGNKDQHQNEKCIEDIEKNCPAQKLEERHHCGSKLSLHFFVDKE